MYAKDKLYEVRNPQRRKAGDAIPIRFIGGTVSITIYGSEEKPDNISDMKDIASDDSPFVTADWYNFDSLPRFIAFVGTVTDIEVSNVALDLIGDIT